MYYLNPLPRRVLITPDEVIKQSSTDDKLDPRKILNAIQIAEERFVRPLLGWDMYDDIAGQKNLLVDSANISTLQGYIDTVYGSGAITLQAGQYVNATELLDSDTLLFWNEHLWKYIAECVRFVAMPEVYANFTSQGIMKNHPVVSAMGSSDSAAASVSLGDVKWLMDKWNGDRIGVLESTIHEYLCRNIGSYGLYTRLSDCLACKQEQAGSRQIGWITNMYDDDDDTCCPEVDLSPAPVTIPTLQTYTHQFTAIDGQDVYPMAGQSNEDVIRTALRGARFISLSREGFELFVGAGPDETTGLNNVLGEISWNTPADSSGQRFILKFQKRG